MEDIKKTFDNLFYKIAVTGRLNLSFIEDLKNFCDDFKDHKDFTNYSIKARSTMSMIYYHHELLVESFNLDFEFLQENLSEKLEYSVIIGRISKTSSILMRTDGIKDYVNKYILNSNDFLTKLILLDWYTSYYPQEVENNDNFEKVVLEIIKALGAPYYNELIITERIKKLKGLNYYSARYVLHQFHMSYQQATSELRPAIFEEYINKTPLKYYQDIMRSAVEKYKL